MTGILGCLMGFALGTLIFKNQLDILPQDMDDIRDLIGSKHTPVIPDIIRQKRESQDQSHVKQDVLLIESKRTSD